MEHSFSATDLRQERMFTEFSLETVAALIEGRPPIRRIPLGAALLNQRVFAEAFVNKPSKAAAKKSDADEQS
jgi:hypothetical protein